MPREISWTDAEEIGIQLQEKFPHVDPLSVRFTDLHRFVTELEGFADDPAKSNESKVLQTLVRHTFPAEFPVPSDSTMIRLFIVAPRNKNQVSRNLFEVSY